MGVTGVRIHTGDATRSRGGAMRRILLAVAALVAAAFVIPSPAAAAGLTAVASFGSNPGNLGMYEYVPASRPAAAPVVVAMHGCTQTADNYYANSGWPKYADAYGFVVVFPEQHRQQFQPLLQ